METLYLGFAILVVCFVLGAGMARLLLPPKFASLRLWLSPWFGIAGIAIFGGILSTAKLTMQTACPVIIVSGLILALYSLFTCKFQRVRMRKEQIVLAALVIALFLINVYPLLTRVGYPTTLSMGNLDPVAYMSVGEYLHDHTILDGSKMNVMAPSTWSVVDLLHYSFRAGPSIILSFFSVLLHVKTYVIYSIFIALAFALTFPLVYLLGKKMLGKSSYMLMWILFLVYGLNATLLYWLTQAFFPQFLYGGIFIASVLLFWEYANDRSASWRITVWDVALGICLVAIMTVYPDGLLMAFSPIILAGVIDYIHKRDSSLLIKGVKVLAIAFVINPITFATAIRQIMRLVSTTTNTTFIGWELIRIPSLFEMMGLHNLYYARDLPLWVDIMLSSPILYCILLAIRHVRNKIVTGSYVTIMLAFLGFYLIVVNHFFIYNRVVGYTLFMWSVLFAVGLVRLLERIDRKLITLLILVMITLATARSTIRSLQQYYYHCRAVDSALSSLESLPPMSGPFYTADIVLGEFDLWKRMWQEHFLRNQAVVDRQNYSLLTPQERDLHLVLVEKERVRENPEKFDFTKVIWENEWYTLGMPKDIQITEDLR